MTVKLEHDALRVWPKGVDVGGNEKVLAGEYDIPGYNPGATPIVLDIGAHIGAFSAWASANWPDAVIFAYEPHPTLYKACSENLGGNAVVHKTAVGAADGTTMLFQGLNNLGESSLKPHMEVQNNGGPVKLVHARHLPECNVLKIDTEGSELDILRNYPHLDKCSAVVLEWHGQRDREEIRELMVAKGFSIHEDSSWFPTRGLLKFIKLQRPHLFVAILVGGGRMFYENEMSVSALRRMANSAGFDVTVSYDPGTGVDRARNRQVAKFLESGATHLMMLDNDIEFRPTDVTKMLMADLDFVSGVYPRKQIEWGKVAAAVKMGVAEDKLHEWSCSFIYNTVVNNEGGNNAISKEGLGDFVEIEEVGTGFMIIKRSVIEKMLKAYEHEMAYITDYDPRDVVHHMVFACGADPACEYEKAKAALLKAALDADGRKPDTLYDACSRYRAACNDNASHGRYLTEDYRMCRLWRMLGGKIYAMVDCDLNHIGNMTFTGRFRHDMRRVDGDSPESGSTKDQSGDRNS